MNKRAEQDSVAQRRKETWGNEQLKTALQEPFVKRYRAEFSTVRIRSRFGRETAEHDCDVHDADHGMHYGKA